jgi:hypothetical protein
MSSKKEWQICHKKLTNKMVTKKLVAKLRRHHPSPNQVARDLDLPTERVRNWYYKSVGMTAYDLILLILHYDFVKRKIDSLKKIVSK